MTVLLLISFKTQADVFSQTFGGETPEEGQVIVERPTVLTGSYKERRSTSGALFSLNYEKYYPLDYTSQFANAGYIEDIIGLDTLTMLGAEIGYKRNIQLGSISVLAGYAKASHSSGDVTAATGKGRSLEVNRISLSANFALDNFF